MNIDDLRQELSTMAGQVYDTDATTRLKGVDHKVKTANRTRTISAAVALAAVGAVAGFAAPQLLATSDNSTGPADGTPTQQTQPSPTTDQTPTTHDQTATASPSTPWTPVGRQTFVDAPDNAAAYVDITRVEVTNGRQAVEFVVQAADLEPGAAVLDMMITSQLKGYLWTAKPLYAIYASGTTDSDFRARMITEPESGLGEVKCPGLTAETSSDASSEMRVSVPRTCLSELEPGPFRLELRLYPGPSEVAFPVDYLSPRPIVVK